MTINKMLNTFIRKNKNRFIFLDITALQMFYDFPGQSENIIRVAGARESLVEEVTLLAKARGTTIKHISITAQEAVVHIDEMLLYLEFTSINWFRETPILQAASGFYINTLSSIFHRGIREFISFEEPIIELFIILNWIYDNHEKELWPTDVQMFLSLRP